LASSSYDERDEEARTLHAHHITKELHHLFKLRGSQSQPDQSFDMHRIRLSVLGSALQHGRLSTEELGKPAGVSGVEDFGLAFE
jgi:hypothetical protein